MKPRIVLALIVLIPVGYVAFAKRYQIAARVWHWRHGYSVTVGDFDVPVPEHWLPIHNYPAFTMADTAPVKAKELKFYSAPVISILPSKNESIGTDGVNFWVSFTKQWLQRNGVKWVEEKSFNTSHGTTTCIGSSELRDELTAVTARHAHRIDTDAVSFECKSSDGLTVMFVGEPSDVGPFYSLVSRIQRHK